jgi:hypothetical protein
MHMGSAQVKVQVRNLSLHYEEDESSRADKRDHKTGKDNAPKVLGGHVGSSEA